MTGPGITWKPAVTSSEPVVTLNVCKPAGSSGGMVMVRSALVDEWTSRFNT